MSADSKQKNALGRRKSAVTRIFISKGTGVITVNDRTFEDYFTIPYLRDQVIAPLKAVDALNKFNIVINAQGGGVKGQAGAAQLAIARSLVDINPELRSVLKLGGYLTRDPRSVERKKFGHKKARKSFQFSKR